MTVLFFSLSGLDVVGALESKILANPEKTKGIIDWVYAQQVKCKSGRDDAESYRSCGFRGGTSLGLPFCVNCGDHKEKEEESTNIPYNEGHLASTFTALSILRILGDDFSRVDKEGILKSLRYLQREDGRSVLY